MKISTVKNPLLRVPNGYGQVEFDHGFVFLDPFGDPVPCKIEISITPEKLIPHEASLIEYFIGWKSTRSVRENVITTVGEDLIEALDPAFITLVLESGYYTGAMESTVRWQWQRPRPSDHGMFSGAAEDVEQFPEPMQ